MIISPKSVKKQLGKYLFWRELHHWDYKETYTHERYFQFAV